jgi:type I restriction enzyme S subunit
MKLKDVVREVRTTYKGDMTNVPIVGLEHIIPCEITFEKYMIDSESTFSKVFKKGQVLFGRRRAYQHKAAIAHIDGICSGDIMVLEAIPDKIEPNLLPFIIQNDDFFDYAIQHSEGGLSPRVKWSAIANYEFTLPSLPEQKVLADKLWAAYRVKESYKKLLAATDDMLKAKFQEMFGDIFENTRNWKEYGPFPKYTEILLGSTPKSSEPSFWNGDVLWITPAEMLDEIVVYSDTARHITKEGAKNAHLSILPKGTVLFSTRAPIGKVGIVGQEMYCNQGFKNFHCGEMLNEYFLYYSLLQKREYFQGLGTGSTFKELSKSTIEKICIAVPPLKLQCDFAKIFTQAEATKESLRKSIENIDQVIKSLINQ